MRRYVLAAATLLATGCSAVGAASPELACQRRLAAAREAKPVAGDDFNHHAYASLDRTGCTAKQLTELEKILALTTELPLLTQANNAFGHSNNQAAQMAAFQEMNNAVIALNALEQAVRSDLAKLEAAQ